MTAGPTVELGGAASWARASLSGVLPKLIFMNGEMGAGKTTFVTKVAEALGAPDAASPSFALHTRYEGSEGTIDHFDLDRLEDAEDLESTGFWDLIESARASGPAHFVMIEWAKRLDEFGAGTRGAPWTRGFDVQNLDFSGSPTWAILRR